MNFPTRPGVFTASLTPLNPDSSPDLNQLVSHVKWLLGQGSDGVALLGSTGEANSLTMEQRLAIIEHAPKELPPEKLMLGTGSCSIQDAIRLTRASLKAGVFTVLVLPPFYYRPQSEEGAFRYFSQLIDTVSEERLRIIFYNFPQLTGFSFSLELLMRLRERYGAVAAGIKDSSGDWDNMKMLAREMRDFSVYVGTEKFLLDILREGGAGCITATGNLTSPACREVYRAWRSGNAEEAENAQQLLTRQRLTLQQKPFVSGLKGLLQQSVPDLRWNNLLPPFVPLSQEEITAFSEEAHAAGIQLPVRD
ncbi:MAG: dihydrodipicolinate synthase family protein [SAR324 cluster bacterium]|nr:dihydrodipicolinate synthase family protein [SAR324 cluster bacterium]